MLAVSALSLAGCLPMMAANLADVAVGAARGRPVNNEQAGVAATKICTARAEPYGVVHVIDTEQHTPSEIIVWGTADDGKVRTSFKCSYGTKITGFSVKELPAQH